MKHLTPLIFLILILGCGNETDDSKVPPVSNNLYILENEQIELTITRTGGMYTGFILKDKPVNPFGWALTPVQMPENNQPHVFAGHFLCTGRWGAPSDGEMEAGIPHNGEVNTQPWRITKDENHQDGSKEITFQCNAPIEKMDVERKVLLPDSGSWFMVRETFTNHLPVGRMNNIVQHGTIAPPFLTSNTIINTNATDGFDQRTSFEALEDSSFVWPHAVLATGEKVDLRNPKTNEGFVTTHLFPDTVQSGWITAYNPDDNLLTGYVFPVKDYPWFNYWYQNKDGNPHVRGLEFGTTGMGQPYKVLLNENVLFHNKPSWIYTDAGEKIEKSWLGFVIQTRKNIKNTLSIKAEPDYLEILLLDKNGNMVSEKIYAPQFSQIFHP